MKVICKYNSGKDLAPYENITLSIGEFGRFGVSESSEYGTLDIGREYLVMGIFVFETYQGYLIDGDGLIAVCPCQLFEIVDASVPINWKFRTVDKNEKVYPFVQAVIGYPELCSNSDWIEKRKRSRSISNAR